MPKTRATYYYAKLRPPNIGRAIKVLVVVMICMILQLVKTFKVILKRKKSILDVSNQ